MAKDILKRNFGKAVSDIKDKLRETGERNRAKSEYANKRKEFRKSMRESAKANRVNSEKAFRADGHVRKIQLNTLQSDYLDNGVDMIVYASTTDNWLKMHGLNREKMDPKVRILNDMMQRRLLYIGLQPMMNGVTSKSVMQSVGMFIGMYAANKSFRQSFRKGFGGLCGNLAKAYDDFAGKDTPQGYSLRLARDKYLKKANDGRLPLTAESAAMTYLSFVRQAHYAARKDGSDPKEVENGFNKAVESLNNMMAVDGVDRGEFEKQQHILAYHYANKNLEGSIIFAEVLGYNKADVFRTTEKVFDTKNMTSYDQEFDIWDGKLTDDKGREVHGIKPNFNKMSAFDFMNTVADETLKCEEFDGADLGLAYSNGIRSAFTDKTLDYDPDSYNSRIKKTARQFAADMGIYSETDFDKRNSKKNEFNSISIAAGGAVVTSVMIDSYKKQLDSINMPDEYKAKRLGLLKAIGDADIDLSNKQNFNRCAKIYANEFGSYNLAGNTDFKQFMAVACSQSSLNRMVGSVLNEEDAAKFKQKVLSKFVSNTDRFGRAVTKDLRDEVTKECAHYRVNLFTSYGPRRDNSADKVTYKDVDKSFDDDREIIN